ncbi:MAG: hypothetical protein KDC56_01020 [Flavobacteriaceae bacterium]|nr:hypothetical protein [Flavobacteriaceae bacterium]
MKKITLITLISLVLVHCTKEDNFLIARGPVGKITTGTKVNELKAIFAKDSLVSNLGKDDFAASPYDEFVVYDKNGNHLLTIRPKEQNDSTSTIESVQIFDKRYKTATGLGLNSAFKDIVNDYKVDKVESTFTTAVLFVNELDATIAIDKKDLGIKDFGTQKIALEQIPDLAKIKTFTLWFD